MLRAILSCQFLDWMDTDMQFDTTGFRARYRASIKPRYSAWLHGGFVFLFGALCIAFFWSRTEGIKSWEWLAVPVALLLQNWGEYKIHKNLGHVKRRFSKMFYQRHTGDHHSFFTYGQMSYEGARDWRVILFPAWLIVVFAAVTLASYWVLSHWNTNVAALFSGTLLLGYLAYETLHACEHLPEQHPLSKLPWVRHMRRLHELHHARDLMHTFNFNIVFPLWDWIYGTLYWEKEGHEEDNKMIFMQHHIDINRSQERVLSYLAVPTRWHEWHHYPVSIKGPSGVLSAGAHFAYTGGRAGHLLWDVIEYVPGQRWKARARGRYGLVMFLTYECSTISMKTRFTRTLEYRFSHLFGRLANHIFLHKRIEKDSADLLNNLSVVAEQLIPTSAASTPR